MKSDNEGPLHKNRTLDNRHEKQPKKNKQAHTYRKRDYM